jgi:polyphosphate glucokinase
MNLRLGIDLGGSAIKAGVVDTVSGSLVSELISVATPSGASLADCCSELARLKQRFPEAHGAVGVALPTVIKSGVACTAANIGSEWLGAPIQRLINGALGCESVLLNDGDAAGLAEIALGAGRGVAGTTLVLTFGTGIGSALFSDGHLMPNTELGRLMLASEDAEAFASARTRSREGLDWSTWALRVNHVLARYQALFWPDLFIIGGGVSEHWELFGQLLSSPARIVPARFRQSAGVVGAAMAAAAKKS